MDTIELRAAAARLQKLHERFAPCFGRRECREHSLGYLRGLLLAEGRKSVEPMALVFGGPSFDQVKRREKTRVPAEITFQTKPQIAATLLARSSVHFDWVTADEEFGRDGDFLDALERSNQRYLVEVPANTTVWADKPLRQTPDELVWQVSPLARTIPAKDWRVIQLREGAKGPLAFEFARLRVWSVRHRHAGPQVWLLIRRSLEPVPEVKDYFSNAAVDVPLETKAMVTGSRWRVEEFLEDAKGQWGMGHYEARSWTSWHHHMSLVALSHLYVVQTRRDLHRHVPDLTVDMAMRLLRAALPRPHLTLQQAGDLVDYYRDRNEQAAGSHRQTWMAKHLHVVPRK